MSGRLVLVVLAGVLPAVAQALDGSPPWRIWADPLALAIDRDDHAVVLRSSFSPEPCVYDAAGRVLPGHLDCRYDHLYRPLARHRYLRQQGSELVLAEEAGAGALVRVWMTTGDGFSGDFPADLRLRIRLDGNPIPYVDLPVRQWFDGSAWPFLPPLVGDRHSGAGAGFAYLPIAFRSGMEVTLAGPAASIDQARIWYQFTVVRAGRTAAAVASGLPADLEDWRRFMATEPGRYPWPQAPEWTSTRVTLPVGAEADLGKRSGSGALLALRLRPDPPGAWQDLRLAVTVDGEQRIDLPLTRVFGSDTQQPGPVRSLLIGEDDHGFGYLYLPQPFHEHVSLRLANPGPLAVAVDAELAWSAAPAPEGALPLSALALGQCLAGGRHDPDAALLRRQGRGRWVALLVDQRNQAEDDANYLEGDERLYLDGSPHPVWHGTGVEDFFNGGFYFDRGGYGHRHALALSGAPWHRLVAGVPVRSRMYRLNLLDAVPFQAGLDLRAERGAYGDQAMCVDGVAWAYHAPGVGRAAVARLDLADPASVAAADYQAPAGATCAPLDAAFADEPPTRHVGRVCTFTGGASRFRFALGQPGQSFWLRRRFDGMNGGQAATVLLDEQPVARIPFAMANPHRRWQEVEVPLDLPPRPAGATLDLRVVPDDPHAPFSEARYVLLARAGDALFDADFEPGG